ncbi:MAG: pseudouridine synthase [Flavobacteriales bacterium]|nr:pseudouridine synthase [Flavobacteriales bacterium]
MRINKYLSEIGFCSRRKADKFIQDKEVFINGTLAELGSQVDESDEVKVQGKVVSRKEEKFEYLIFNKPKGIECTTDVRKRGNIISFINYPKRIFPVGRLDKNSHGLIFMTSDGDLVNKVLRSKNNHEKEYKVRVDKKIDERFISRMSSGIPILGKMTKKCKLTKLNDYEFLIVLTEGMNRQIRRMCEYLNYNVKDLQRIRIMHINLDIPTGKYRKFTKKELTQLYELIQDSSKEI